MLGLKQIKATVGGIVFGVANALSQRASNLFWDDTNLRFGIGTATPLSSLHLQQRTTTDGFTFGGVPISGGNNGSGFLMTLGYNFNGNKQFWLGDPDYAGKSTGFFTRFGAASGYPYIDVISGNNVAYGTINLGTPGGSKTVFGAPFGVALAPLSQVGINGSFAVGAAYYLLGAPANGAIYQGAVGIGTSSPSASAILDLTSTTLGFAPPRMTSAQMNAIVSPVNGMQVHNTSANAPFVNLGTPASPSWQQVNASATGFGAYVSTVANPAVTVSAAPANTLVATIPPPSAGSYAAIFNGQVALRPAVVSTQNTADLNALVSYLQGLTSTGSHALAFGAGETITPGVYDINGAATGTGALTLSGGGNANAVIIIRVNGACSTAAGMTMTLTNGMQACNVFWLVTGAPSFGAGSTAAGSFIGVPGAVAAGDTFTLNGRLLSTSGAITTTNAILLAPATVSATINVGNLQNFVAYSANGAVSNTGTIAGNGDIGTGVGAVGAGYAPPIGNVYPPTAANARATFATYVVGVLVAGSQRVIESPIFNMREMATDALAVIAAGQAVEVRIKVDCGSVAVPNSFLSTDRKA